MFTWGVNPNIYQMIFSNAFPLMIIVVFLFRFQKFVSKGPIYSMLTLVEVMPWYGTSDKALLEALMIQFNDTLPSYIHTAQIQTMVI